MKSSLLEVVRPLDTSVVQLPCLTSVDEEETSSLHWFHTPELRISVTNQSSELHSWSTSDMDLVFLHPLLPGLGD